MVIGSPAFDIPHVMSAEGSNSSASQVTVKTLNVNSEGGGNQRFLAAKRAKLDTGALAQNLQQQQQQHAPE